MQTFSTLQLSQTHLNSITAPTSTATGVSRASKRKFESDDGSEKLDRIKRFQTSALSDHNVFLAEQHLLPSTMYCSPTTDVTSNPAIIHDSAVGRSFTAISSTAAITTEAMADDCMMLEDDSNTTDDDDNLKTPSYMDYCNDNNGYLQFDTSDDLEDGGFTGQLERGWHELYSDPEQTMWY